MITVSCVNCGNDVKKHPSQVREHKNSFCNQKCHNDFRRETPSIKICLDCDRIVKAKTSVRCGECARRAVGKANKGTPAWNKGDLVTLVCVVCETRFDVWPSVARGTKGTRSARKTCGRTCANKFKALTRGVDHPLFKEKPVISCKTCGKDFEIKPCKVNTEKKFCSRECVGSWVVRHHQQRISSIEVTVAKELNLRGVEFCQQVPVGSFVPDFVIGNTIIEVDGDYWHALPKVVERDKRKNKFYAEQGYTVIRIPEHEIRAGDFSRLDGLA